MLKKIMRTLLAGAVTAGVLLSSMAAGAANTRFADVPANAWYASSVQYAVDNKLFTGTSSNKFTPSGTMTRGMFVTVLSRLAHEKNLGVDVTYQPEDRDFSDVPSNAWYADAVEWAWKNNFVNTYVKGSTFDPNAPITREEVASTLNKYLAGVQEDVSLAFFYVEHRGDASYDRDLAEYCKERGITDFDKYLDTLPQITATKAAKPFVDVSDISSWAFDSAYYMQSVGLMVGDNANRFQPKKTLTRAEAAAIFMRLNRKLNCEDISTVPKTAESLKIEDFKNIVGKGHGLQMSQYSISSDVNPRNQRVSSYFRDTVELARYVDFGGGVSGTAKTVYTEELWEGGGRYHAGYRRMTYFNIEMTVGQSVTIDLADFPSPKAAVDSVFSNEYVTMKDNGNGTYTYTAKQAGGDLYSLITNTVYNDTTNNDGYELDFIVMNS